MCKKNIWRWTPYSFFFCDYGFTTIGVARWAFFKSKQKASPFPCWYGLNFLIILLLHIPITHILSACIAPLSSFDIIVNDNEKQLIMLILITIASFNTFHHYLHLSVQYWKQLILILPTFAIESFHMDFTFFCICHIKKCRHETFYVYVYQPWSGYIACKFILIKKKDKEINKFNNKACINTYWYQRNYSYKHMVK